MQLSVLQESSFYWKWWFLFCLLTTRVKQENFYVYTELTLISAVKQFYIYH